MITKEKYAHGRFFFRDHEVTVIVAGRGGYFRVLRRGAAEAPTP
jgi:hypothetical protein